MTTTYKAIANLEAIPGSNPAAYRVGEWVSVDPEAIEQVLSESAEVEEALEVHGLNGRTIYRSGVDGVKFVVSE